MRLLLMLVVALTSCAMQPYYAENNSVIPTGRIFQQQLLNKVNALRAKGCKCGNKYMPPAAPLKWSKNLELAALKHAEDMYRNNYFSHTSLNKQTIKQRIEAAGYKLTGAKAYAFGENIAYGQRSIDRVMQGWIQSEGHCKNLMNPSFRDIGVAQVNYYWVQEFGMSLTDGTYNSSIN